MGEIPFSEDFKLQICIKEWKIPHADTAIQKFYLKMVWKVTQNLQESIWGTSGFIKIVFNNRYFNINLAKCFNFAKRL